MTVGELKSFLEGIPDDVPILMSSEEPHQLKLAEVSLDEAFVELKIDGKWKFLEYWECDEYGNFNTKILRIR